MHSPLFGSVSKGPTTGQYALQVDRSPDFLACPRQDFVILVACQTQCLAPAPPQRISRDRPIHGPPRLLFRQHPLQTPTDVVRPNFIAAWRKTGHVAIRMSTAAETTMCNSVSRTDAPCSQAKRLFSP